MYINEVPNLDNIYDYFDFVLDKEEDHYSLEHNELVAIHESCLELIDEYMQNHILTMKNSDFDDTLKEYVITNMSIILVEIVKEDLHDLLEEVFLFIKNYYFSQIIPPRSYRKTFIRTKPNIDAISKKIEYIKSKPQPDQRTEEWYYFRHNLLTASSIWKVWGSESMQNQIIYEKCKELNVEKYNSVNTESSLHHGQRYEEVSVMYYEHVYKTKVEDFGCIKHDDYYYIGASPDGINVDPDSPRYGRMLEIKNPSSREITGIPKEEYWIQMQVQMETCDLNECDFLETKICEYETEEEYQNDIDTEFKGIIIYFMKNGKPHYEYMPFTIKGAEEQDKWINTMIDKHAELTWIKNIYWKIEQVSCILVLRNKEWFKKSKDQIKKIWEIIEKERIDGCLHRAPKKNQRKRSNSSVEIDGTQTFSECLINEELFCKESGDILKGELKIEKNIGEQFVDLSYNNNIIG
jgi:putative phage-type endonuclease